jgi:hypothetical protein
MDYEMGAFAFSFIIYQLLSYARASWGGADNYLGLWFHCLVRLCSSPATLRNTGGQPSETSDDHPLEGASYLILIFMNSSRKY